MAETIELVNFLFTHLGIHDEEGNIVWREEAFFPWQFDDSLRFIADDSNRRQVARLSAGTTFDASAPLVQLDRFSDYPPVFQYDPIVTFADGMWGNFEANASASGYFAFRFDLNADGDPSIEQRQYGWARITFPEFVDTDGRDGFSITIHEWGWGEIGDTAFRIGDKPEPPPLLSIAQGSAGRVELSWSGTNTVYQLQQAPDLVTTNWMNTPEQPVLNGITNTVTTPTSADLRFYRLTEKPPPPPLSIARGSAGEVDLFWSGTNTVYQLQHTDDLTTSNWMKTPEQPVVDGLVNTVTVPTSADLRFYRLTGDTATTTPTTSASADLREDQLTE